MEIFPPKKIKIAPSKGKGRGVFATEDIAKGEIIEYCPIIFLSDKEVEFFENEKSNILQFYYLWQYEIEKYCIMLGYGSIYNHSRDPNADIDYDLKEIKDYLIVEAIKDIKNGEEIVFDYFDGELSEKEKMEKEFLKMD